MIKKLGEISIKDDQEDIGKQDNEDDNYTNPNIKRKIILKRNNDYTMAKSKTTKEIIEVTSLYQKTS